MIIGGVCSLLAVALLWNVVTSEISGQHNGRHHATNFNIFGILILWGATVPANLTTDAVKRICTMVGCSLMMYLVAGIPSDFHTMPITSIGYLHMLRSWTALPFGWDDRKGYTPEWARKAFAGLVFAYFGMIFSFASMLRYESPPPPLNRSRARKMNQLKMILSAVMGFFGIIGCICLWSSVLAETPSGEIYRNNPLYFPTTAETYHDQTYGDFALGKGLTSVEAYGEVMSTTSFMIVTFLFVVALLISSSEEIANVTLITSSWYGWFLLGHMFEIRFELDKAISTKDLGTMTAGYIFVWFASIATVAISVVVLIAQSQTQYKRGAVGTTGNKVLPVADDIDYSLSNPSGLPPITDVDEENSAGKSDDQDDDYVEVADAEDTKVDEKTNSQLFGANNKKTDDDDDDDDDEDEDSD